MKFYIVKLCYDVFFHDSDEGNCLSSSESRNFKAFLDEHKAKDFVIQWNDVFKKADKETIFCPRQQNNQKIFDAFGFDLHSFCQDEANYHLKIEELKGE